MSLTIIAKELASAKYTTVSPEKQVVICFYDPNPYKQHRKGSVVSLITERLKATPSELFMYSRKFVNFMHLQEKSKVVS